MSQSIVQLICGEFWVPNKAYHSPLSESLAPWYGYCSDGGHCIICCLAQDYEESGDLTECLIPVPVKTVLKSYEVKRGLIVVDLPYSPQLGLVTPATDDEY